MRFVLDATAIRSGISIDGSGIWFTTPSVMGEVERGKAARDLELREGLHLEVLGPKNVFIIEVIKASEKTGDTARLSETDIEVLALALELGAILVTDDYSVQNVAECLGVQYQGSVNPGIKEVFSWTFRCTGCGRYYEEFANSCEICGSAIKMIRR
jgi:UPF0271 protein